MLRFVFLAAIFVLSVTAAQAELLTPEDREAYRAAFVAAQTNDWTAARRLAAGASE